MNRKEALREVRGFIGQLTEGCQAAIKALVPELAESEDERIRKRLLWFLANYTGKWDYPETRMACRAWLEKQKEQKPVDKFQEYLNVSPAERRKMNMDEILGDNKWHQKTSDALTTDSNKESDTSDCKYKNLDDIAQEYVDGVRQYNSEPTWDLMQTAVCYGYHLAENKQKPAEWSEEDEKMFKFLHSMICRCINDPYWEYEKREMASKEALPFIERLKSLRPHWKPSEELMRMLLAVINDPNNASSESAHIALESLYNDLKKL